MSEKSIQLKPEWLKGYSGVVESRTAKVLCNELKPVINAIVSDDNKIDDDTDLIITVRNLTGTELENYRNYTSGAQTKIFGRILEGLCGLAREANSGEDLFDALGQMVGKTDNQRSSTKATPEVLARKYLVNIGTVEPQLTGPLVNDIFDHNYVVFSRLHKKIEELTDLGDALKKKPTSDIA